MIDNFDVYGFANNNKFIDTKPITGAGTLVQRWMEENHGLRVVKVEKPENLHKAA